MDYNYTLIAYDVKRSVKASTSSCQMLSHFGWASVALTVMPIAALMLAIIVLRSRTAVTQ